MTVRVPSRFRDMATMIWRTLVLYAKSPAFRTYMSERKRTPKDLFAYFGYVLLVGRKE